MAGQSPADKAEARLRAGLLRGDEITNLPDPEPLIEGLLPLDGIAVLFGPSGTGKSLLALDWALHVASRLDWWGRKTRHGPVLYVVAEGARGTKWRYEAWREFHEVTAEPDITWLTVPANVLETVDRHALLRIVAEVSPILTVLDTLARHIPGGDENSFETMSHLVETLDEIRRITHGTAKGVHHAGKNEEAGSRGHSSLKGALDAELKVQTRRVERAMHVDVYAEKFKDWEDHKIIYSAHMEKIGRSMVPVVDDEIALSSSERQALACLNGQFTSWTDWQKASGLARSTFGRIQKKLREMELIEGDPDAGWRQRT